MVGDVVKIETGNKVPADIRITWNNGLKVEQSSLTGEVDAIEAGIDAASQLPMEAKNIIFNSCLVMEGQAYGIVFRTGDNTLIGNIARMTARPKEGNLNKNRN